jgi:hypothetical protein
MPERRSPHRARHASPPGPGDPKPGNGRPAGVDEATTMHRLGTQHCAAMGSRAYLGGLCAQRQIPHPRQSRS